VYYKIRLVILKRRAIRLKKEEEGVFVFENPHSEHQYFSMGKSHFLKTPQGLIASF